MRPYPIQEVGPNDVLRLELASCTSEANDPEANDLVAPAIFIAGD